MNLRQKLEKIVSGPETPDREFVISQSTYGEVYSLAHGLLESFNSMELEDDVVLLCTENKTLIAASILAVICGGPMLAIPHSLLRQSVYDMHGLNKYRAAILDEPRELPEGVVPVIPKPGRKRHFNHHPIDMDRDIISLFTGGSTGKPVIWPKTIRNLFGEGIKLVKTFNISPHDRFLATVPPYHIYGLLFSIIAPFLSSASVIEDNCTFPHEIVSSINKYKASILVSVPAHYRILKGHEMKNDSLRIAFSSAGTLDKDDGEAFSEQTGVGLVEVYGSTETGGIATRCRANGEEAFTPFEDIDWKIQGERLKVRSDLISRGVNLDEDGFFLTGDRVAGHGDEGFFLMGRTDGVVKVGGKRVDLDQVREKIQKLPLVREAAVIALPEDKGRENLVAALVAGDVRQDDLRNDLHDSLESYAFPRIIRIVDKIPKASTGKIDRVAIERIFQDKPDKKI